MKNRWLPLLAILVTFGLVAAACGDDDAAEEPATEEPTAEEPATEEPTAEEPATEEPAVEEPATEEPAVEEPATEEPAAEQPAPSEWGATLADGEFDECYSPDPDIVAVGLGGAGSLPVEERARNVALATLCRASIQIDEDLALQCWQNDGCDTGTGGELKVALADGFGGNPARQIFKMEFILQSLTYPEIGEIAYTDANLDTQKAISDVQAFTAQGFDVILSFPDAGEAMVPAYRAATDQGAKVVTWSSAPVGEPGVDFLTYSGSDICTLANAWGNKFNELLPDGGDIAMILGAPGNPIDPIHERCLEEVLSDDIQIVAKEGEQWSREAYLEAASAIIAEHPDLDGIVGSYGDAFVGAMRAFEAASVSMEGLVTMHQSDDNPFLCAWRDAGGVSNSWHYVALLLEGRAGLTSAMMSINGYDVPSQVIFGVELKQLTPDSCRTDIPPTGSPSSLVPASLQTRMFPE